MLLGAVGETYKLETLTGDSISKTAHKSLSTPLKVLTFLQRLHLFCLDIEDDGKAVWSKY